MLLHNLIVFCFDRGESNYITVSSYGAHWVKDKKCPNRNNAYFLLFVTLSLVLRSSTKLLSFYGV